MGYKVITMPKKEKTHLDDMSEWQDHQYDPPYDARGETYPSIQGEGNPRLAAVLYFVGATVLLLFYCLVIYRLFLAGDDVEFIGSSPLGAFITLTVVFWLFILLFAQLGRRYRQKAKQQKRSSESKE